MGIESWGDDDDMHVARYFGFDLELGEGWEQQSSLLLILCAHLYSNLINPTTMASQATTGAGASIDNNLNPTTMALQATNGAGDSIEKELYIPKDFVKVCNCIAESRHPKKQMWQFALRTDSGNSTKGSGKKRNPDIRCLACQKVFRNCTITAIKNHSTAKSNFCTKMTENIIARVKEVLELKEEGKETIVNPGSKKLAKPVGCKQALLKLHKVKTAGEQAYSLMVDALLHSVREEMDFRRLQNLSDATGHLKHMLSQLNSVLNEIAPGTSVLPNESAPGTSVLPNESAPDTSVLPNESAPDTSVLPNESAPYNRHLESSEGFKVSKLQSMVDGAPNNKHLEFFEFDLQEFEELEALLEPKLQAPAALVQPHPSSSIDFGTHSLNALPPSQQQAHGNDPDEQIHNPAAPIRQLQGQSPARND
uniref:Uncharacterized protein n=1 Tax=Leersia perrieri TaxID=77586 RepID=A0A0D9W9H2_9ORYZ